MSKVLVMMSGGVDSSVAAALLMEQGHEVTGVTLRLADSPPDSGRVGGCCSLADVEDARCVAHFLGVPHYSLNEKEIFAKTVLENFKKEYQSGRTPNPCYRCNQWIKFDYVYSWARELGFDLIATGHYARVVEKDGSRLLKRGADREKDQTYFLASMNPRVLEHLLFPLGEMVKSDVRQEAERFGLITADKVESQELCFAHDLDYRNALEAGTPGKIVSTSGAELADHPGITHFTVGQRKGIGLSGGPFYVIRLDPVTHQVVVGGEEDLLASEVEIDELNTFRPLLVGERLIGMPRYRHEGSELEVLEVGEDRAVVRYLAPERALTPGQVLAMYDGDCLVAGSVIQRVMDRETIAAKE